MILRRRCCGDSCGGALLTNLTASGRSLELRLATGTGDSKRSPGSPSQKPSFILTGRYIWVSMQMDATTCCGCQSDWHTFETACRAVGYTLQRKCLGDASRRFRPGHFPNRDGARRTAVFGEVNFVETSYSNLWAIGLKMR